MTVFETFTIELVEHKIELDIENKLFDRQVLNPVFQIIYFI